MSPERRRRFRDFCRDAKEEPLANLVDRVGAEVGPGPHRDFNAFMKAVAADATARGVKLTAKRKTLLKTSLACRDETAEPVIKAVHLKGAAPDAVRGLYPATIHAKPATVEYEPDTDLRDTEQIPLLEAGRHRVFHTPRSAALRPGRLVRPIQRQDRLRDQLHPPLLRAQAAAAVGGDTGGHTGVGAGDGRPVD